MKEIYELQFVEKLFDKMSSSYSKMNYITSFRFSKKYRRQYVEEITIGEGKVVVDLMTRMGKCWKQILKNAKQN